MVYTNIDEFNTVVSNCVECERYVLLALVLIDRCPKVSLGHVTSALSCCRLHGCHKSYELHTVAEVRVKIVYCRRNNQWAAALSRRRRLHLALQLLVHPVGERAFLYFRSTKRRMIMSRL